MNNAPIDDHLDESTIAAIAEGAIADAAVVEHLARCVECRRRVSAVSHLLADPGISAEIDALDRSENPARRRWSLVSIGTMAAAAAIAIMVLGKPEQFGTSPRGVDSVSEVTREGVITPTPPPQIVSTQAVKAPGAPLQWMRTPGADLYRVRVWNTEGAVVLSVDTPDTTLLLPKELEHAGATYLWEVKARTGWDRWVSSEFLQFSIDNSMR